MTIVVLAENWWLVALRGVAAIVFGLLAIFWPGLTLLILVWLFGVYAVVDGIFAILGGVRRAERRARDWLMVLRGIAGVAAGVIALVWTGITALVLLIVIAAWAISTGILEMMAAYRRRERRGSWLLVLVGIASVLFGLALILLPGPGALALVLVIGAYAIASGLVLLIASYRLRELQESVLGFDVP